MKKILEIEFLYLDLKSCQRCIATDSTLREALNELSDVLEQLGYSAQVNKVNITSIDMAKQYQFISSPTIRVNGVDICDNVTENNCCSCGEVCGVDVDCRTFVYEGKTYEQPPKGMIIEGIMQVINGKRFKEEKIYILPDNLKRFFKGRDKSYY